VFQRPESQVLGVRAADDLRWGLPADEEIDVDGLLASVGLEGFAGRETATLSGGELQRLAIAAALARRPALLISDESTAMVDPAGRRQVMEVLHSLPAQGMAVVHVTHHLREAAEADLVVMLENGRVKMSGPPDVVLGERTGV
jgi:energy-coupling factor transporter ATP-binding protein EcfA2